MPCGYGANQGIRDEKAGSASFPGTRNTREFDMSFQLVNYFSIVRYKKKEPKMSTHKKFEINTVEELVQYASQQRSNASRFTLEERSIKVEERTYQKYLSETGHGWSYALSLMLSDELGKQIDAIWTKKEPYRGASYTKNYGSLSLQGILKRLGKSDAVADIANRIKAAEKAEEAARAKRNRNYKRKQIREKSQELYTLLTSVDLGLFEDTSETSKDIHFFKRLSELTKILDEE